jgi:hypothetical protein
MLDKGSLDSLSAEGQTEGKECLMTTDTGASVMIPGAGLPERDPPKKCALKTASGETFPIPKEALITMTVGGKPTNYVGVRRRNR